MQKNLFRNGVSYAFAAISVIALVIFEQTISAFATKQGWDQFLVNGWKVVRDLGWADIISFSFFALGGATVGLWIEYWFRDKREGRAKLDEFATSCHATLMFSKGSNGSLEMTLNSEKSDNVAYWAWYVNNGGTMRNEAVLVFIEFEKPVQSPEVFSYSATIENEWREIASTDRFVFVDLKGWPVGEVVVQAIDSKALGLDRRSELMVWRKYAAIE